jgi:hypothetical protein
MDIEIVKGVYLYSLDEDYYIPKDRVFACLGLCELSYLEIVNQYRAKKWLEKRGFSGLQPKQLPSSGGCCFREMLDWQSWMSLMEYLSDIKRSTKAVKTLNKVTQALLRNKLDLSSD